jgi:hypothetical protein
VFAAAARIQSAYALPARDFSTPRSTLQQQQQQHISMRWLRIQEASQHMHCQHVTSANHKAHPAAAAAAANHTLLASTLQHPCTIAGITTL